MRPLAGTEHLRGVKVLILTTFESDGSLFATLRGGASGFLVKDSGPTEVLNAVRVVASGEALLSPAATRRLIEEFAAWPERGRSAPDQLDELTDREREVMALVAYGLTNREIAERLLVSPATAKTHVSRAMGSSTRTIERSSWCSPTRPRWYPRAEPARFALPDRIGGRGAPSAVRLEAPNHA